jgi:hypothetical protein
MGIDLRAIAAFFFEVYGSPGRGLKRTDRSWRGGVAKQELDSPGYIPRAPRFPIQTRLHYRANGSSTWEVGTAVNISRSGILFEGRQQFEPETMLEMRIILPAEITRGGPVNILCRGPVIRRGLTPPPDPHPVMAMTIDHYRLAPAE